VSKPWSQVQSIIIEKASRDDEYRRRLLEDPIRVTEEERGERLPEDVRIKVIEAEPETGYILLPPRVPGELPDSALEAVAGGTGVTPAPDSPLKRGGWDGNHIETMRRSVRRTR
jgi:hypothetical protein